MTEMPLDIILENTEDELELDDNPLDAFRTPANETTLSSKTAITSELNEAISIAPGEGVQPLSILSDPYCEELAHPYLFPTENLDSRLNEIHPLLQASISTIKLVFSHPTTRVVTLFHRQVEKYLRLYIPSSVEDTALAMLADDTTTLVVDSYNVCVSVDTK